MIKRSLLYSFVLLCAISARADFGGFGGDFGGGTDNGQGPAVAIGNNSYQTYMPAQFNQATGAWECQSMLYTPVPKDGFTYHCVLGNGGDVPGAVHTGPRNTVAVGDACGEALDKTKTQCKGAELAQYAPTVLALGAAVQSQKAAGNMKKACESAKQLYQISGISNAAVAGMCQRAISNCKKACTDDSAGTLQCEDYETYAKAATGQAVQSATAMIGSQACADAVAGKCQGDSAYNDEECTQFCLKPGRQDHPKCKIALNNCSSPDYASQNLQYCTCVNNPFAANCTTIGGTNPGAPVPGSVPGGDSLNFDDGLLGGRDFDYNGGANQGTPARVNAASGGGGGGLDGGGGSFAFGSDSGTGTGQEPLDKDILYGTSGSNGGGLSGGGGGYGNGGYGGGARGGGAKDSNGIDLKAFLPGGKKDPTRNPASAGYSDPTITKANGLTNWQKVTRKMNEKRPELMP